MRSKTVDVYIDHAQIVICILPYDDEEAWPNSIEEKGYLLSKHQITILTITETALDRVVDSAYTIPVSLTLFGDAESYTTAVQQRSVDHGWYQLCASTLASREPYLLAAIGLTEFDVDDERSCIPFKGSAVEKPFVLFVDTPGAATKVLMMVLDE